MRFGDLAWTSETSVLKGIIFFFVHRAIIAFAISIYQPYFNRRNASDASNDEYRNRAGGILTESFSAYVPIHIPI